MHNIVCYHKIIRMWTGYDGRDAGPERSQAYHNNSDNDCTIFGATTLVFINNKHKIIIAILIKINSV